MQRRSLIPFIPSHQRMGGRRKKKEGIVDRPFLLKKKKRKGRRARRDRFTMVIVSWIEP